GSTLREFDIPPNRRVPLRSNSANRVSARVYLQGRRATRFFRQVFLCFSSDLRWFSGWFESPAREPRPPFPVSTVAGWRTVARRLESSCGRKRIPATSPRQRAPTPRGAH